MLKNVSLLSELPEATRIIFEFDAQQAWPRRNFRNCSPTPPPRGAEGFIPKVLAESTLTYERFREITKAVQKERPARRARICSSDSHGGDRRRFRTGTGKADSHLRGRRQIAVGAACEERGRAAEGICRGGEAVSDCNCSEGQYVIFGAAAAKEWGSAGLTTDPLSGLMHNTGSVASMTYGGNSLVPSGKWRSPGRSLRHPFGAGGGAHPAGGFRDDHAGLPQSSLAGDCGRLPRRGHLPALLSAHGGGARGRHSPAPKRGGSVHAEGL